MIKFACIVLVASVSCKQSDLLKSAKRVFHPPLGSLSLSLSSWTCATYLKTGNKQQILMDISPIEVYIILDLDYGL